MGTENNQKARGSLISKDDVKFVIQIAILVATVAMGWATLRGQQAALDYRIARNKAILEETIRNQNVTNERLREAIVDLKVDLAGIKTELQTLRRDLAE